MKKFITILLITISFSSFGQRIKDSTIISYYYKVLVSDSIGRVGSVDGLDNIVIYDLCRLEKVIAMQPPGNQIMIRKMFKIEGK